MPLLLVYRLYGLYTALVPPAIYAIMGSARQVSPGPVAMDSLLVFTGVSAIAQIGTEYYLEVVFLLTAMVGIIQFALGFFRLGFLVNFLSKPVISGFTSAAALVIGMNQVKHLFKLDVENSNFLHHLIYKLIEVLPTLDFKTVIIGMGSVGIILVMKRFSPKIPSALVVVVLGIGLIKLLPNYFETVNVVGYIPEGLPAFHLPVFDLEMIKRLLPVAVTLSLLGFLELISIAKSQESTKRNTK